MADPTTTPPPASPPPPRTDQSAVDPDDRGYDVPARAWLVHGAIIIAFALFVTILGLLYIRWDEAKEPNSSMTFLGNDHFDGVQVHVDGPKLDKAMVQMMTPGNDFQVKFPLPAGTYLVRITRNGQLLASESSLVAREGVPAQYDLRKVLAAATSEPTTQSTTQPAP